MDRSSFSASSFSVAIYIGVVTTVCAACAPAVPANHDPGYHGADGQGPVATPADAAQATSKTPTVPTQPNATPEPEPRLAAATGNWNVLVVDEKALPLVGAAVTVAAQEFATNANGLAHFRGLPEGCAVAKVVVAGFGPAGAVAEVHAEVTGLSVVRLQPTLPVAVLDAVGGGEVMRGPVRLQVAPGGLVDANGQPVTGAVQVVVTPIDPTGPTVPGMPGPLVGVNGGSPPVPLQSLMMADVSLAQNGAPVQLASGKSATLTFDLPSAAQAKSGEVIPA
jgi:hypothetical protein